MSLTANQAAQIIKHNGNHIQSAELVEICEKLIAVNIEDIVQQPGGHCTLLETLTGFVKCEMSRQKILDFLCARIVEDYSHLTLNEKCLFLRLLTHIEDEVAGQQQGASGQIQFSTSIDSQLETIEPYIVD